MDLVQAAHVLQEEVNRKLQEAESERLNHVAKQDEVDRKAKELDVARLELEREKAEVAKIKDVIAFKAEAEKKMADAVTAQSENNKKTQELIEWEKRLYEIKLNQDQRQSELDKTAQDLDSRQQVIKEQEENWLKDAKVKFVDDIKNGLTLKVQ